MEHEADVVEELTADHLAARQLFETLRGLDPGDGRRREAADEFTVELVRHSVAEEQFLYPALREHVSGGDALADRGVADHERIEQLLKELEEADPAEARFEELIGVLAAELTAHIEDTERNLLPALVDACSAERLDELGDLVRTAKALAPTRPHPGAPDWKLLAAGTSLVDRARDFLAGRGRPS
ncbi:hemerythrin domain-containing protein [Kitasatospora sp. NBC_01302]|uniref:hemerythrin domain-containing protein n=1 Tax=Kitasatospora sp. NBC_01302 TaxID=2903575 RepID=UPI002E13DE58|nr:hemerythrin domain-containing protein [Kitasatospora sp. NBC_01302]